MIYIFISGRRCEADFADLRASPTDAPKLPRGKLTAGLPRGRARVLLQRARKNGAAPKTFALRARLRHPARQSWRSGCRVHYITPRATRTNRHGNFTPAPPRVARSPPGRPPRVAAALLTPLPPSSLSLAPRHLSRQRDAAPPSLELRLPQRLSAPERHFLRGDPLRRRAHRPRHV
jgi:hypothetical protein